MGEHELWLEARDISALRLKCEHCPSDVTFVGDDESGTAPAPVCANCNMPMSGVTDVVRAYRKFVAELKRTKRGARFLATLKTK